MKNYYLIRFTYDHYCQGFEEAQETVLVKAVGFEAACNRIRIICNDAGILKYQSAREFENLTIEL